MDDEGIVNVGTVRASFFERKGRLAEYAQGTLGTLRPLSPHEMFVTRGSKSVNSDDDLIYEGWLV